MHFARLKFCSQCPGDRKVKISIAKSITTLLMQEGRHGLIALGGTQRDHDTHAVSSRRLFTDPDQQVVLHTLAKRPARQQKIFHKEQSSPLEGDHQPHITVIPKAITHLLQEYLTILLRQQRGYFRLVADHARGIELIGPLHKLRNAGNV